MAVQFPYNLSFAAKYNKTSPKALVYKAFGDVGFCKFMLLNSLCFGVLKYFFYVLQRKIFMT